MYTRDPIGSKKGSYKQTNRTTQVWKFCHLFQKSEMKMGYNENESECWLQLRQSRLSSPDGALPRQRLWLRRLLGNTHTANHVVWPLLETW